MVKPISKSVDIYRKENYVTARLQIKRDTNLSQKSFFSKLKLAFITQLRKMFSLTLNTTREATLL